MLLLLSENNVGLRLDDVTLVSEDTDEDTGSLREENVGSHQHFRCRASSLQLCADRASTFLAADSNWQKNILLQLFTSSNVFWLALKKVATE